MLKMAYRKKAGMQRNSSRWSSRQDDEEARTTSSLARRQYATMTATVISASSATSVTELTVSPTSMYSLAHVECQCVMKWFHASDASSSAPIARPPTCRPWRAGTG